ncbi:MAG: hypothetical protein Q9192_003730 [Flavoplaca navasiana]
MPPKRNRDAQEKLEQWPSKKPKLDWIGDFAAMSLSTLQDPSHGCLQKVEIPGKGDGYTARQGVAPGTLILAESPLFTVDDIETGRLSKSTEARIDNAVQQLDPAELEHFRKLAQPFKNRKCLDKERFLANSFLMTRHPNGRQTKGIFLGASGFNHSCIPNACFNWNPNGTDDGRNGQDSLTVCAIRNIIPREEIVINYLRNQHGKDIFPTAEVRQGKLKKNYNFSCDCSACQPGSESAARWEAMSFSAGRVANMQGHLPGQIWQRLDILQNLVRLVEQEGLVYPQKAMIFGQLAELYIDEMFRHRHNDEDAFFEDCRGKALEAYQAKLDVEMISLRENSEEMRKTWRLMQRWRLR